MDLLNAQTAVGDKIIVFSQYVDTLKWLQLRIKDIPLVIYHGGLSQLVVCHN